MFNQFLVFIATYLLCVVGWSAQTGAVVKVNGMVCSFCSTSIEKKFKEHAEVSEVTVDLENKKVVLVYAPSKTLKDEQIKDIITKAGYTVVSIDPVDTSAEVKPEDTATKTVTPSKDVLKSDKKK